ncbi:hypothetical protein BH09MYX1_BH09MYX1_49010 [soil metagenome]
MKLHLAFGVSSLACALGFALLGCGSNDPNRFLTSDSGGNPFDDDSGIKFGDGGGDGGACSSLTCSSDLHSVIDCNGNVQSTCPDDQGCGAGGVCVPACDSAKANKSSIGCDYYSVDPDIISAGAGGCFAAYIANTWSGPITLTVERNGQTLNLANFARIPSGSGQSITYQALPGGQLPAGQVAILFLAYSGFVTCPGGVTAAVSGTPAYVTRTGRGKAFHITSSRPVVAYDIFPYGGGQSAATSATLLLPTTSWDTNYIGVNAFRKSQLVIDGDPSMDILAQEDGTTVTISPTNAITAATGVVGTAKGVPVTYNLSKGEYVQFTQPLELTGSAIQSNKPIGLWGGASCLNIDVSAAACDSAHQQIPPVQALGYEYIGARYRNRVEPGPEEAPPWRLVGAVNGTTLSWDPGPPSGAPLSVNQGQVVEFNSAGPFRVKSQDAQHPFYMSAHMTGGDSYQDRGDPEFVNVIPPQQYLRSYVFFTDPTYSETNLVVVRAKNNGAFSDVSLDCSGTLSGWKPVGSEGKYEYTRIDLVRGNFQKQGNCDNGRHEMKSAAPFGLTVWGWGSSESTGFGTTYVSYAYPAGASVKPVNTVVVPPTPN